MSTVGGVAHIKKLPDELLWRILDAHLPRPWHIVAAFVCARWRRLASALDAHHRLRDCRRWALPQRLEESAAACGATNVLAWIGDIMGLVPDGTRRVADSALAVAACAAPRQRYEHVARWLEERSGPLSLSAVVAAVHAGHIDHAIAMSRRVTRGGFGVDVTRALLYAHGVDPERLRGSPYHVPTMVGYLVAHGRGKHIVSLVGERYTRQGAASSLEYLWDALGIAYILGMDRLALAKIILDEPFCVCVDVHGPRLGAAVAKAIACGAGPGQYHANGRDWVEGAATVPAVMRLATFSKMVQRAHLVRPYGSWLSLTQGGDMGGSVADLLSVDAMRWIAQERPQLAVSVLTAEAPPNDDHIAAKLLAMFGACATPHLPKMGHGWFAAAYVAVGSTAEQLDALRERGTFDVQECLYKLFGSACLLDDATVCERLDWLRAQSPGAFRDVIRDGDSARGCVGRKKLRGIIERGHLCTFVWLATTNLWFDGCKLDRKTRAKLCAYAARARGGLPFLAWMRGVTRVDPYAKDSPARMRIAEPVAWDARVVKTAIEEGRYATARWAIEAGCLDTAAATGYCYTLTAAFSDACSSHTRGKPHLRNSFVRWLGGVCGADKNRATGFSVPAALGS
jgi:hypothetical protein